MQRRGLVMLIQHHKASEYYDRAIDQFEQLYDDAAQSARIMALVVHPYIMGAPHRLKYFRNVLARIRNPRGVLVWTGQEILDWYLPQSEAASPRLGPAIHVFGAEILADLRRGCPGRARAR